MAQNLTIREEIEQREIEHLAPYASLCVKSKGRLYPEEPCSVRTAYMRDRDRIIYSKAFRRLKHKTQVFIAPEGDHYRTRSTHTIEVAQISRTLARALLLNEDLTEAIALGHDLGHTPFGHSGEAAIDEVFPPGFRHNEQSLRVVDKLEGERGLNLTWEVRDGILCHTGPKLPSTLEGQIVRIADRISYINHDIDDAIRAGIISEDDLPKDCVEILGNRHKVRINTMVTDIIKMSRGKPIVAMSDEVQQATDKLREFLFERVYIGSEAKLEEAKAQQVVKTLYDYYLKNPDLLSDDIKARIPSEGLERCVVDYIAGMTDRFAMKTFERYFVPNVWMK
ncbi:MAG TPA: deoxyguanosinetriphosphate triphosphohydrolase [Syntrophaceticus sp.]|nr:deoxyguanosinetriphosphate triphosphohydrolase [Syntrophaceticus sp.]